MGIKYTDNQRVWCGHVGTETTHLIQVNEEGEEAVGKEGRKPLAPCSGSWEDGVNNPGVPILVQRCTPWGGGLTPGTSRVVSYF